MTVPRESDSELWASHAEPRDRLSGCGDSFVGSDCTRALRLLRWEMGVCLRPLQHRLRPVSDQGERVRPPAFQSEQQSALASHTSPHAAYELP